jgi:general secretion pathway protein F
MAKFVYTARDKKGEKIEGTLEVEDRQAVINRLQTMGFFPVKIQDVTPKSKSAFSISGLRGKVSTTDLVGFNRQLADLVGAGIPLVKALGIILAQTRGEVMREIVADINKNVQSGDSLAQALQRHPKVFSPLTVAMVRAGETGGMLEDVLFRLADYAENEAALKGKVLASLAYPAVMVVAGTLVIIILITVVMPKITGVFADLNQALPLPTQIMMQVSGIVRVYWWIVGIGLVAAVVALRQFFKTAEGRSLRDAVYLRIPILGGVIHKRQLALFTRTLGNLLHNGVPILTALEITTEVIRNVVIQGEVKKVAPSISQGGSMAGTLTDNKFFPPAITSMIAVGEETAQLDKVLLKISDTCEREVDRALKTLTSMLEPLIILALGIVVGFIVISMMLPIMGLDPTAGQD